MASDSKKTGGKASQLLVKRTLKQLLSTKRLVQLYNSTTVQLYTTNGASMLVMKCFLPCGKTASFQLENMVSEHTFRALEKKVGKSALAKLGHTTTQTTQSESSTVNQRNRHNQQTNWQSNKRVSVL